MAATLSRSVPTVEQVELRDGSVAQLRLAGPGDHDELARFCHRLSPDSLRRRFFGAAEPSSTLLNTFCAHRSAVR